MRRSASASAAIALGAAALAAGAWSGSAGARLDAGAQSCDFAAPAILPEPAHTRGLSNTIRWEKVPSGCWENDDNSGQKSKERRFVVTITNLSNGEKETVTVRGDGEVDATIDPDELPAGPGGAIDGQRFRFAVVRKESICGSGSPSLGICTNRYTRTSSDSAAVESIQDARAPSGSLRLGTQTFVSSLVVAAAVTATDPGGGAASGPGYVEFSSSSQFECRGRACDVEALGGPLSVRLEPGPDGVRTVHARVYDRARRGADDPGTTTIGTPPGNVSPAFSATVIVDRTPPTVFVRVSTIRATTGVPVTFDGSASVDVGGLGADSGVEPSSASWELGDGTTVAGRLVATHSYAATGTYPIAYSLADRLGNMVRVPLGEIVVVAAPVPPVPQTTTTPPPAAPPAPVRVDRTAPLLSKLSVRRRGARTTVAFRVSERATVQVEVRRLRPRPVRRLAALTRRLKAGRRSVVLPRAATRKPGRYQIVLVARDAAGNRSRVRSLRLTTKRR